MDGLLGYFSPFFWGIERAILFMCLKPVQTDRSLLKMPCNWRTHSEVKEAKVVFISNSLARQESPKNAHLLRRPFRLND